MMTEHEPKMDLPVYKDVMFLFQFISYTGASTFVQYGEGKINPGKVTKTLRVLQQVACVAVFLLLLAMSVFEFVQFGLVIWSMDNIGEIIPNIIWMTSFPLALLAQIFYAIQRSVLIKFFQRWEEMHMLYSVSVDPEERHKKHSRPRMYFVYLLTVCISVAMIIVVILDFPIMPFLPSTYLSEKGKVDQPIATSALTFTKNLFLTCVLFSVTLFYAWNLSAASDLVPSMIYFHLAVAMEKTGNFFQESMKEKTNTAKAVKADTEEIIKSPTKDGGCEPIVHVHRPLQHLSFESAHDVQPEWQKGWLYYEAVRQLVNESNARFGPMLLLNHGAMFFVACSNVFSILRWYRGMSWLLLLANGLNAAATLLRFTTTILLCSKLSTAVERLQSKISTHLAANWFRFGVSERQFFTAFLVRVHDKGAVASPLGLYSVRPSMLLALLSLLVTYMIVLLQTSADAGIFTSYGNYTGLLTGTRFYTAMP